MRTTMPDIYTEGVDTFDIIYSNLAGKSNEWTFQKLQSSTVTNICNV